ncbi:unnamed protein product [Caenorhabditis brenneri]
MVNIARNCVVCDRLTSDFSYGVDCCNACKMFFRRHIIDGTPLKTCLTGDQNCDQEKLIGCQLCRFHKCLLSGMVFLPLLQKTTLENIIDNVNQLNVQRKKSLYHSYPVDKNLTVSSILFLKNIVYVNRNIDDEPLDFYKWSYISTVSTIEFLKSLVFVYLAKHEDQLNIVKSSFLSTASLFAAFRACSAKQHMLTFPDGLDIFPLTLKPLVPNLNELETRIRCRLVGKLHEIKLKYEELLLVLVVIICNPALPNLTETGKILLSSYQNHYSSSLLQYCMQTYQRFGPTRYTELLSIINVLSKHCEDVNNYFVILQLNNIDSQLHDIVREGIETL